MDGQVPALAGPATTAGTAADFLSALIDRLPFPVRAVQVDGGSEFMADFEAACAERALPLFVLPPRSPKPNGHVERANRTHRAEVWERSGDDLNPPPLQAAVRAWEDEDQRVRPHQALGDRTPAAFLTPRQEVPLERTPRTSTGS